MAKLLFTAVVADMRNKLNGTVFSKNRYGAYARTKVTPVNPQTTAQQNARSRLATQSQAWRGLTQAQRDSWIAAAPNFPITDIFGNQKILSGQALFVKLNTNLSLINFGPLTAAPMPVAVPSLLTLSVAADDSANTVIATFTDTTPGATYDLLIYATPNITPGREFVKNEFRFIETNTFPIASPLDISTAWRALFGDPVTGQKIFIKAVVMSNTTGQIGVPLQTQTIVVA